MPLEERESEFPLVGGLDTKEHAELEDPSSVRELDGFRFGQLGRYERMTAVKDYLTITPPSGSEWGTTSIVQAMIAHKDEPIGITDHFGLVSIVDANGTKTRDWKYRNTAVASPVALPLQTSPMACTVKTQVVASAQGNADYSGELGSTVASALYQNYMVTAWIEVGTSGARLMMRAFDVDTMQDVSTATEYATSVGATGGWVSAFTLNEVGSTGVMIAVAFSNGAAPFTISGYRWSVDRSFSSVGSLTNNAGLAWCTLCASTTSNRFYLAFNDNTTGFLHVQDRSLGAVTSTHIATHPSNFSASMLDVGGGCLIVSADTAAAPDVVYAEMFGSPGAAVAVFTGGATHTNVLRAPVIAAQRLVSSGYTYAAEVFVNTGSAFTGGTTQTVVQCFTIEYEGTISVVGTSALVNNSVALAGFSYDDRAFCVFRNAGDNGSLAPSMIVGRANFSTSVKRIEEVARIGHDIASSSSTYSDGFATAVVVADAAFVAFLGDTSSFFNADMTAYVSRIDFAQNDVPFFEHGGCTYFCAGSLMCYDGVNVFEAQPTREPVIFEASGSTTISAKATYEFVDARGNVHRSPVSVAATFAAASNVYVEAPGFNSYDGVSLQQCAAQLWCNDGSGGTTYRRSSVTPTLVASGHGWQFAAVAAVTSSSAEQLYTNSGELESEPPPSLYHAAVVGDRVWAVNAENRSEIWFTKPFVAGYAPEWNATCTITIGDEAEAVCDVGGVPTILGKRGVWQVYGEGPNANGVGEFAPARRLPHEVGCVTRASVVKTPIGVFFQAENAYVVLGNDLSINPIGLPIAPETRTTTSGRAIYDRSHNEIRVINGYFTYLYSIDNGRWSRRTNSASDSSQVDPDDIVFCGGRVWSAHNAGAYIVSEYNADDSSSYAKLATNETTIETPWIKFDGVAGFGKLWRILMPIYVPQDTAASTVSIEVYTDYDASTIKWVHSYSTSDVAEWGTNRVETLVLHPRYQKVQAIKLRWTQSPDGGGIRAAITPLALRFKYGVTKNSRPSYNRAAPGAPPS